MTTPTERVRRNLSQVLDKVGQHVRGDQPDTDLVLAVELALRQTDVTDVHDLPALVRFVRESLDDQASFAVIDRGGPAAGSDDPVVRRFDALLANVAAGLPPLPVRHAVLIGQTVDRLAGDRTPFDRSHWSLDVGAHAMSASSRAHAGRFLYQAVRYLRVQAVLELGTGYGVSGLYFLAAMADSGSSGRLETVELSQPQHRIASAILNKTHGEAAQVHHGRSRDVLATLPEVPGLGLVFHDGGHDRDQYVGDFAAVEPRLASGAMVIYDDITWQDSRRPDSDMRTYEGWTEVRRHERVARAAEVGNKYGLVLLR